MIPQAEVIKAFENCNVERLKSGLFHRFDEPEPVLNPDVSPEKCLEMLNYIKEETYKTSFNNYFWDVCLKLISRDDMKQDVKTFLEYNLLDGFSLEEKISNCKNADQWELISLMYNNEKFETKSVNLISIIRVYDEIYPIYPGIENIFWKLCFKYLLRQRKEDIKQEQFETIFRFVLSHREIDLKRFLSNVSVNFKVPKWCLKEIPDSCLKFLISWKIWRMEKLVPVFEENLHRLESFVKPIIFLGTYEADDLIFMIEKLPGRIIIREQNYVNWYVSDFNDFAKYFLEKFRMNLGMVIEDIKFIIEKSISSFEEIDDLKFYADIKDFLSDDLILKLLCVENMGGVFEEEEEEEYIFQFFKFIESKILQNPLFFIPEMLKYKHTWTILAKMYGHIKVSSSFLTIKYRNFTYKEGVFFNIIRKTKPVCKTCGNEIDSNVYQNPSENFDVFYCRACRVPETEEIKCPVCLENFISGVFFSCGHFLCQTCNPKVKECLSCRKEKETIKSSIRVDVDEIVALIISS